MTSPHPTPHIECGLLSADRHATDRRSATVLAYSPPQSAGGRHQPSMRAVSLSRSSSSEGDARRAAGASPTGFFALHMADARGHPSRSRSVAGPHTQDVTEESGEASPFSFVLRNLPKLRPACETDAGMERDPAEPWSLVPGSTPALEVERWPLRCGQLECGRARHCAPRLHSRPSAKTVIYLNLCHM